MVKIRRSWAFDPPEAGKIDVKVINRYSDEVLKVYETTPAGQFTLICITN